MRAVRDEEKEKCYFSVVDIISTLTDSSVPKRYWFELKKKVTKEESQLYQKIVQLKFEAVDMKKVRNKLFGNRGCFQINSIHPITKSRAVKLWLAQVASERLDEMQEERHESRASICYVNRCDNKSIER